MNKIEKRIVIKNDIKEIPLLNKSVKDFCSEMGINQEYIAEIVLAVEETVVNIINYGFPEKESSEIVVDLEIEGNDLKIVIEDSGLEFDPTEMKDFTIEDSLEEREIGGLGIYLVKNLMDYMEYHRKDDKNILILKKLNIK